MFKRRTPLTKLQLTKEVFWPTMGWWRAGKYTHLRIARLSDTTRKIAVGLAIGASISFSPLLFTHFIQAGIIAWVVRANIPSALIGTFVGNPWTFPFMWWASISLGSNILTAIGLPASTALPDNIDFSKFFEITMNEPSRIFMPWALGGYLIALLSWPIFYFVFYNLVRGAKRARSKARLRAVQKLAREVTGQKE